MEEWIYETSSDNSARYLLGLKVQNPLICIGVNPSTASPDKLDNTLKSVDRFSRYLGYDGWIMMNLYPQRATYPDDIHHQMNIELHDQNIATIEKIMFIQDRLTIWAAWGNLIEKREFLNQCLQDIYMISTKYSCEWINIGKISKNGHPHHPLYLNKNAELNKFDIESYMLKLKGLSQSMK